VQGFPCGIQTVLSWKEKAKKNLKRHEKALNAMKLTSSYLLGLSFIVVVSVIWAVSSVVVQYIFNDDRVSFRSPFLLTYICVSLFTLWLPTKCISRKFWGSPIPIGDSGIQLSSSVSYQTLPATERNEEADVDINESEESATETVWTDEQHRKAAMYIAPVWFLANWTYNGSLAYTSVTSSTVLASTGSLFTFLFAVCSRDESFSWMKLLGVSLGVAGSVLTAAHDSDDSDSSSGSRPLLGDILGIISAVGYGGYAVQTRLLCPRNEELYSMQLLLGYIGLFNCVVLSPFALYLLSGNSEESRLTWLVFGILVVKGLFDNVLSDYLWLRAVILTNATVATVGLGLTIPLAFFSDVAMGNLDVVSFGSICGALAVLAGFVLVNAGVDDDENVTHTLSEDQSTTAIDDEQLVPNATERVMNEMDED